MQAQHPPCHQVNASADQQNTHASKPTASVTGHRQTSRLANRFQRREDYDAEYSIAEDFDDWRATRAQLKSRLVPGSLH